MTSQNSFPRSYHRSTDSNETREFEISFDVFGTLLRGNSKENYYTTIEKVWNEEKRTGQMKTK